MWKQRKKNSGIWRRLDYLWLKNSSKEHFRNIQLVNAVGQNVFENIMLKGGATLRLELKAFVSVVYLLRYRKGDTWFVEKVIIQ